MALERDLQQRLQSRGPLLRIHLRNSNQHGLDQQRAAKPADETPGADGSTRREPETPIERKRAFKWSNSTALAIGPRRTRCSMRRLSSSLTTVGLAKPLARKRATSRSALSGCENAPICKNICSIGIAVAPTEAGSGCGAAARVASARNVSGGGATARTSTRVVPLCTMSRAVAAA